MSTSTRNDATQTAALDRLGVAHCYQCGKCSAGCPMADQMDRLPNRLVRLVQMGRVERALEAKPLEVRLLHDLLGAVRRRWTVRV